MPETTSSQRLPVQHRFSEEAASPEHHVRADRRLVGLATLSILAFSLFLSSFVDAPFMFHDEFGYLAVSRMLGPGPVPELFGPLYNPGYGLLLSPLDAAISSGARLHLAVQVVNALIVACLVPILFSIGRRVIGSDSLTALTLAIAGASTAAVLTSAQMLIPEVLLSAICAASVLLLHRWLSDPASLLRAGAAGSAVGIGYLVHPRSIAAAAALVLCCLLTVAVRLVPARAALTCIGAVLLFALATRQLNQQVIESMYPFDTGTTSSAQRLDLVAAEPVAALKSIIGTTWGLCASTLGLSALGFWAGVQQVRWTNRKTAEAAVAAYFVVAVLLSLVLSAIFLTSSFINSPSRPDLIVYGRYVGQWVPVSLVFAGALRRRALAGLGAGIVAFLVAGLVFFRTRYDPTVWDRPSALHNVAGLTGPRHFTGSFNMARDGWWFVGVAGASIVLALRRNIRWLAIASIIVGLATSYSLVSSWSATASENAAVRHRNGDVAPRGVPVAIDLRDVSPLYLYNLQYWNEDLDLDLSMSEPANDDVVIGTIDDPPSPSSRLMSVEPFSSRALWVTNPGLISALDESGSLFPSGIIADQTLPPEAASAIVRLVGDRSQVDLSKTRELLVNVRHVGSTSPWVTAWGERPVRVASRLTNTNTGEVVAETRAEIFQRMAPGDEVEIELPLPAEELLDDSESYTLEIGIVQERVAWFAPPPNSLNPVLQVARPD